MQEQVSREQEEDAAAKAAAAEKQRQQDAEAAEQRQQAAEERQRKLAIAKLKRERDEFLEALYLDIGISYHSSSDTDDADVGKIYYDSSLRYYLEFGYQKDLGFGFRLIGTKHNYFVGENVQWGEPQEDTASASGQGYGAYLNLFCCLTIGINQIGLADGLQFQGIDYNPGVITEYVAGVHSDVLEDILWGFEYLYMDEEEDELRANSDGISLWLRYRFGN